MVGAPGSTTPAPPRKPTVNIFYIDGGCFRISVSTRQGARHRRFLVLMVGAPRSTALAPPREPAIDVLQLGGSRSQTSSNASQGATMSSVFLSKSFLGPCTAKDLEMKAIISTAKQKVDNRAGRRRVGTTCGFVASLMVGPGATVGTL
jgi:hypothetical protein